MKTAGKIIAAGALAFIVNELFDDNNNAGIEFVPAGDMAVNADNGGSSATELAAANVPKNPGMSVNPDGLPYEMGRRQSVTYADIEYASAGRILRNGNEHCSGNAIELEEYVTEPQDGVLVSTAAHCFEDMQAGTEYSFVLDYMDENNIIRTYTYSNPQIWANPLKQDDIPEASNDQAFMFFAGTALPDEITPARLEIYSRHLVRDFAADHFDYIDITAAGFSSDMFGLTRDTDCNIRTVFNIAGKSPYLRTNCQIYYGGSGSGLIFENFGNENSDQITIGAITASVAKDTDIDSGDFYSNFTLFFHHNLAEVPFLRRNDTCARVTAANGLYLRTENYDNPDSAYASLLFNEIVRVTDMLYDEQEIYGPDDVWLEIRRLDNPDPQTPDGYSNSVWLEEAPCPRGP